MRGSTLAVLVSSLSLSLAACMGTIGGDGSGSGENVGEADGGLCVVDTPLRRMTRFEYDNTVRDLLGDDTRPASGLPPEEEIAGFNNQAAALTVSDLLAEQYMKIAEGIGARAVQRLESLLPSCDPAVDGEDVCADAFIADFGRRAFRRPLAAEEKARLRGLYDWAKADPDLGTFHDGIELVIQAALQSPHFLYRPELGDPGVVEGTANVVKLSDWEIASKLSYMIWNTMPDDVLFDAAERGELSTREQIEAQARRMVADDRARDAIANFHEQWLLLTHMESINKDPGLYPAYHPGLRELWREEIHQLIEHVIFEGEGTLTALLTTSDGMMNQELAAFYGDDVIEEPIGEGFERVALDPSRRAGILTTAALLATHAKPDQSSPVFRGKMVREQLMCETLPLPPNDLIIEPPPLDPTKTTREQFEEIGNSPECAYCHALMNPVGFGFEHYDAIGRWRDTQNDKPIDASGEIIGSYSSELEGPFDGAVELAHKLAESDQVASCVASQWFRFSYNRTVTEHDGCNLDPVMETFRASGLDIRELIVALTQTDSFIYRHQVGEGGAQ